MAPLDDLLLAEAREAQAAQAHALARAELSRARFADALRRLHGAGASMREIAGAFKISHQRVHQLVTGEDPKGRSPACSFCAATTPAARKLIAGPGVHVCDGCVAVASRVATGEAGARRLWAQRASSDGPPGRRPRLKWGGKDTCSFCGKQPHQVASVVRGVRARICSQCLDLCREIIAEELGA